MTEYTINQYFTSMNNATESKEKIKLFDNSKFKDLVIQTGNTHNPDNFYEKLTIEIKPYGRLKSVYSQDFFDYGSLEIFYYNSKSRALKFIKNGSYKTIGFYEKENNKIVLGIYLYKLSKNEIMKFIELLKEIDKLDKIEVGDTSNKSKEILIKKIVSDLEERRKIVEDEIISSENNISDYERSVLRNHKLIRENLILLESLKQSDEEMVKKLLEDMEKAENLKCVKKIKFGCSCIILEYENIYILHRGTKVYIGDFEVKVFLNGNLEIINKNPLYVNNMPYHHPHISQSNTTNICMGDKRELVHKYLKDYNIIGLAQIFNLFLKAYTVGDNYVNISYWKNVEEKEGKRVYIGTEEDEEDEEEGDVYCDECGSYVSSGNYNRDLYMCYSCEENTSYCVSCSRRVNDDDFNQDRDMCNSCWEDNEENPENQTQTISSNEVVNNG